MFKVGTSVLVREVVAEKFNIDPSKPYKIIDENNGFSSGKTFFLDIPGNSAKNAYFYPFELEYFSNDEEENIQIPRFFVNSIYRHLSNKGFMSVEEAEDICAYLKRVLFPVNAEEQKAIEFLKARGYKVDRND